MLVNLNSGFDIVAVSETWDSIGRPVSTTVNIPGCTIFSKRSQSQNGSVGLYIKTCLGPVPKPESDSDSGEYETVWAEIETSNGKNILICCAYRHPSNDTAHFTNYLQRSLSNQSVANKHVFLLGLSLQRSLSNQSVANKHVSSTVTCLIMTLVLPPVAL